MPVTAGLLYRQGYGIGYPDWISVATPSAGSNATFLVPGEYAMRMLAAHAVVTTSATVANRFVSLDYINQRGQTFCRNAGGLVVTASTTGLGFDWNAARSDAQWAANTPVLCPLLDAILYPGCSAQVTLDNIQAADAVTAIIFYVEKYETGSLGYELGFIRDAERPLGVPDAS